MATFADAIYAAVASPCVVLRALGSCADLARFFQRPPAKSDERCISSARSSLMTPPRPHRDPPLVISFSPLSVTSSVVAHLSPQEKTASYIAFHPLPPFRCFYCLLSFPPLSPLLRGCAAASPAWQMVNAIIHETLATLLSKESIMYTAGEISLRAREWIAAL